MTNILKNKKSLSSIELLSTPQSKRQFQRKFQRGSGLIEVMVSLLILGVGLLGMLSLQANGLNSGQRALFATEANLLAQDMANRILAFGSRSTNNNTGAASGDYAGLATVGAVPLSPAPTAAELLKLASNCGSGCDPRLTKEFDQQQWQQAFNNNASLPSGRGEVLWDGATDTYTIRIRWDQDRAGATGLNCGDDRSVDLTCFDLRVSLQ
jgi:type IV pilus assembly protein PilV